MLRSSVGQRALLRRAALSAAPRVSAVEASRACASVLPSRLPQRKKTSSCGSCVVRTVERREFSTVRATRVTGGCVEKYMSLKASGEIAHDDRQEKVMGMLGKLADRLSTYHPAPVGRSQSVNTPSSAPTGGLFGFFGAKTPAAPPQPVAPPPLKPAPGQTGLYLWGGTGTGKTFMMDIFFECAPVSKKKRVHFNEWMLEVNARLHSKQKGSSQNTNKTADDIIEQVAKDMLQEAWLICFDEFQVTHISDAIIMKRVFSVLFQQGAVVVATSNRPPEDLYLNGLNRPLFLPFIPMLKDFCGVHNIDSVVDYRMISTKAGEDARVYISPSGPEEKKILEYKFAKICQGSVQTGLQVEAQGRRILIPRCASNSKVAWFNFSDLCDKPLGAADYMAVGAAFHTVFLADIPQLSMQERDQVRRFITLIDTFYESKTKLVCTAAADPIPLFYVSDEERKTSVADEIFAWDRTVSRLMEMQSSKYLSEVARSLEPDQFLGQFKLMALTEEDIRDMWLRYDQDDNGHLDEDETRLLVEDILLKQRGHRNVSNELFSVVMEAIDTDRNGVVSFDEFREYMSEFGRVHQIE